MKITVRPSELWNGVSSRWSLPDRVLDELCRDPRLLAAYCSQVGVQIAFSLRTHTLKVMECYERHFAARHDADPRGRSRSRLFLALHDIGKPRAILSGDKRRQHRFTVDMLREARGYFAVTDLEFEDWIALVDGDPIGSYLKREIGPREAASLVGEMAGRSSLDLELFWSSLLIYYQCDVSAYTRRTGLMNMLDGLFEWDPSGGDIMFDERIGLLGFSEPVRQALEELGAPQFRGGAA